MNMQAMLKQAQKMQKDMMIVAVNDCVKQINDLTEKKMGAYTKGMPGLF